MGSPSPPQSSSNLPAAYMYQPTGQGGADTQLQNYFNNFNNPYQSLQGNLQSVMNAGYNNPYATNYQNASVATQNAGWGQGSQNLTNSSALNNTGLSGLSNIGSLIGNIAWNPYQSSAQQAAQSGGQMLQSHSASDFTNVGALQPAASASQALGMSNVGAAQGGLDFAQGLANPAYQNYGYAQGLANPAAQNYGYASGAAGALGQGANAIMNTAFDPQGQLYQQQYQQNQDATQAALAARGINTSGTGAGIVNQSDQNFNMNWQNQQLARQQAGLASAGNAYGQGQAGLASGLSGMQGVASGMAGGLAGLQGVSSGINAGVNNMFGAQSGLNAGLGALESAATTGQNIGSNAAQNYAAGGAMPSNTYYGNLASQASLLGGLGSAAGSYGGLTSSGANLGNMGLGQLNAASSLPYSTANTITNNQGSSLNNYLNTFANSQNINQQQIGDLLQYLGLGQSAGQGLSTAQNSTYANQIAAQQNMFGGLGMLGGLGLSAFGGGGELGSMFGGLGSMFGGAGIGDAAAAGGSYMMDALPLLAAA